MARALKQILAELDSVYSPQKSAYSKQIEALPGMQQAELGGLDAAKKDSFNQITQGANRRGVAFGGIPLEEQANYLGSSDLPAVANLKGRFQAQKSDLSLRLAELAAKQRQDAYGIRDYELQEDARQRELAEARAAREEARRAASSGGGGGGGIGGFSFNDPSTYTTNAPGVMAPKVSAADQTLFNKMFLKGDGGQWGDNDLRNDYNATLKSARYGNANDLRKIEMYHAARPDLFGAQSPIPTGATRLSSGSSGGRTTLPGIKGSPSLSLIGLTR